MFKPGNYHNEFAEIHRLYSSILIMKELELAEPPPPYAFKLAGQKHINVY